MKKLLLFQNMNTFYVIPNLLFWFSYYHYKSWWVKKDSQTNLQLLSVLFPHKTKDCIFYLYKVKKTKLSKKNMNAREEMQCSKLHLMALKSNKCKLLCLYSPKEPSCMFFTHNNALGPPYRILIDTNFINFSIQNKLDIFKASMDCLLGKCIPYITDCVVG